MQQKITIHDHIVLGSVIQYVEKMSTYVILKLFCIKYFIEKKIENFKI